MLQRFLRPFRISPFPGYLVLRFASKLQSSLLSASPEAGLPDPETEGGEGRRRRRRRRRQRGKRVSKRRTAPAADLRSFRRKRLVWRRCRRRASHLYGVDREIRPCARILPTPALPRVTHFEGPPACGSGPRRSRVQGVCCRTHSRNPQTPTDCRRRTDDVARSHRESLSECPCATSGDSMFQLMMTFSFTFLLSPSGTCAAGSR